jgi:hypothetical protein
MASPILTKGKELVQRHTEATSWTDVLQDCPICNFQVDASPHASDVIRTFYETHNITGGNVHESVLYQLLTSIWNDHVMTYALCAAPITPSIAKTHFLSHVSHLN